MPLLIKILIANAGAVIQLAIELTRYVTGKQKQAECEKKKDGKPN